MTHSNTSNRTFKHLTPEQRGILQAMHNTGAYTQAEVGEAIGVSQSTVSRELKRGLTRQMDSNLNYYDTYMAETGSRVYHENRKRCVSKGTEAFDGEFFQAFEEALLAPKAERIFSVDTFVVLYKQQHPEAKVPCTKTMYTYIYRPRLIEGR